MEKECFCNGGVLDVGTGTGILGMAAALWGAADVLGIDNDAEAVAAARYNVLRNGLQNRVSISERALAEVLERYPLVVANIVHDVLIELAEDLQRVTSPGGLLIVSGLIYGDQTSSISDCFCERGFGLLSDRQEQEWGALMLKKL
jgi:ribosomal protein L11 methyltransferase